MLRKNFGSYLVKCDFELVFDINFHAHLKSCLQKFLINFHLKRFLTACFENFSERGHRFSDSYEMIFSSISNKKLHDLQFLYQTPKANVWVEADINNW